MLLAHPFLGGPLHLQRFLAGLGAFARSAFGQIEGAFIALRGDRVVIAREIGHAYGLDFTFILFRRSRRLDVGIVAIILFMGMSGLRLAQAFGQFLVVMIVLMPMIMLVLAAVGVRPEGIAIILGVDRILDMGRTVLNVIGDVVTATYITRSETRSGRRAEA